MTSFDRFRLNLPLALACSSQSWLDLSRSLGTSSSYMSRVKSGEVIPSLVRCEEISHALGFELSELILPVEEFRSRFL